MTAATRRETSVPPYEEGGGNGGASALTRPVKQRQLRVPPQRIHTAIPYSHQGNSDSARGNNDGMAEVQFRWGEMRKSLHQHGQAEAFPPIPAG